MADNYILYPVTRRGLAIEMKRALDDYTMGKVSNSELATLIAAWAQNCDFMMEDDGSLCHGVASYIGKKRKSVVERLLSAAISK